ncbi:hypothetical protein MYP_819 [Sporocytophaga myxococcoides]|uniref:Uncharacterized protein n=1 Tax=Sporocytophaga myxococcoides TaxID=153721 RepID=A0A098LAW6_9BACT|nr:hypothetical protein MYP_819 [Sporocytophaga myxococcoides]
MNQERLKAFCKDIDIPELEKRLRAFERICEGGKQAGPIGGLPLSGRFRWLTANRSTIVQTSAVHPGLCNDASETLRRLMAELVL